MIRKSLAYAGLPIVSVVLVVIINSYLLSGWPGDRIVTSVIAPMIEESPRFITMAIAGPISSLVYTFLLATSEFYFYMVAIAMRYIFGVPLILIELRMACAFAHFIFFFVQLVGYKKFLSSGKVGYLLATFIIAVILHGFWNSHVGKYIYELLMWLYLFK